jgi:hypothetical protein
MKVAKNVCGFPYQGSVGRVVDNEKHAFRCILLKLASSVMRIKRRGKAFVKVRRRFRLKKQQLSRHDYGFSHFTIN